MPKSNNGLTPAERRRFVTAASSLIETHGGTPSRLPYQNGITGGLHTEFMLDSKFGPLRMSVYERTTDSGGPGDVMTQFEFARLAAPQTGCNPHSGKWNHHYFSPWTTDDAFDDVERWLKQIQPTTLDTFADATSLLPGLIAQMVIAERCPRGNELCDPPYAFVGDEGLDHEASAAWFISHVERRTIFMFDVTRRIREALRGESGRDVLISFVSNWLDAYMNDQPEYRRRRSMLELA